MRKFFVFWACIGVGLGAVMAAFMIGLEVLTSLAEINSVADLYAVTAQVGLFGFAVGAAAFISHLVLSAIDRFSTQSAIAD